MPSSSRNTKRLVAAVFAAMVAFSGAAQNPFLPLAGESALTGPLPGDQVFPSVAFGTNGGFVVWQDNVTDGDGWGVSALRLDNNLSGSQAPFRVNVTGAGNQENARVAMLPNGGAVIVWQGGAAGGQRIFARFIAADGTFATGEQMVNTYTGGQQINPNLAVLTDGSVVVVWASDGQDGSMQGVYGQRLANTGAKLGSEFPVNQTTLLNQRTPTVVALSGGGFVAAWVSERQLGLDGNGVDTFAVDIFARKFDAAGVALGNEFRRRTFVRIPRCRPMVPEDLQRSGAAGTAWFTRIVGMFSQGRLRPMELPAGRRHASTPIASGINSRLASNPSARIGWLFGLVLRRMARARACSVGCWMPRVHLRVTSFV
jgi:hypothetical protein